MMLLVTSEALIIRKKALDTFIHYVRIDTCKVYI